MLAASDENHLPPARRSRALGLAAAAAAPGDWVGIWLNTANGSRLDYVDITYAGAATSMQSNNCRPINTVDRAALFVGSFSDQYVPPGNLITNSRITNSAYFGIDAMWLAATRHQ